MTVQCPKCANLGQLGDQWRATGRRNTSSRGLRRAELVCDVCAYQFSSALPSALAAAEAISGPDVLPMPSLLQPSMPVQKERRQRGISQFTILKSIVRDVVGDWKKKQAADE